MEPISPLLTSVEAAIYLRRPENWLRKRRITGDGPPFVLMAGRVFYKRHSLDEWLASLERTATKHRRRLAA
jgi:hypothetical protein